MDEFQRSEYPAMLANLQPGQAVQTVNDRLKRIGKTNTEIADWLQERRRVEEQYVAGLKRLLLFKVPNASSELSIFQPSWDKILNSTDAIAASHHLFSQRVEKDVESPLRQFNSRKDVQNMQTMSSNLSSIAKELEDAQEKVDKLSKKGGKASALKVDTANARLESASSQWESQAPFILETLQALDEQRCNHLRDVLTQLQTHEVDQADRLRAAANDALTTILEADTSKEVDNFVAKVTGGRPKARTGTGNGSGNGTISRTPTATRQSTSVNTQPPSTADSTLAPPPPTASSYDNDARSEHSVRSTEKSESKLRSRIGTVFGRRRSSVHAGFGQLSPGKGGSYSRTSSSHGRLSPHASSSNLAISTGKLDALAEDPDTQKSSRSEDTEQASETNGTHAEHSSGFAPAGTMSAHLNGMTAEEIFDTPPPPGPPPSHLNKEGEPAKDNDGFTIPPAANDPISQAQREAANEAGGDEHEQLFRLNIQNSPIAEEDPDAAKAAQLSVANTLGLPAKRAGTVRGRRDVRNTVYMPSTIPLSASEPSASLSPGEPTQNLPPSPALHGTSSSMSSKPSAIHTLASEASVTGTSDTQSVRSATSLGSMAHGKHPELTGPGLNSSIVESVSATFDEGALKSVKINGEIAFAYNGDGMLSDSREIIRINDFPSLESIGPNRIFVSSTPSPEEFTLDISHIPSKTATPGFTYRVHAEEPSSAHLANHCPLLIKPSWKPMGDKLGLVLLYKLNPEFLGGDRPVSLKGFTLVATYEGARASGVQTKPTGTHLKDKHLVYWRMGDVNLQPGEEWQKIICRVIGAENAEPKPGTIEARWEYMSSATVGEEGSHFISISRRAENKGKGKAIEEEDESDVDDPFADDSAAASPKAKDEGFTWREVPTVRKIVSGRYEAK
ncbi:Cytoskeletal protein syp1 [Cytospora mali]|uniref:Cytoskeletal protein syp1 n=1 Tax=Cytospora mali TaxID=578113 RepID=A0A194UWJ3_CYTMA|nr:Cytoskeletal protein syp1 [Valsa mali var. pyri (nom. inval.)]